MINKKELICECGSNEFSIIDQRNTDIDLGKGTIDLALDVECDNCQKRTRQLVKSIIVEIK